MTSHPYITPLSPTDPPAWNTYGLDIETYGSDNDICLICLTDGVNDLFFYDADTFCQHITSHPRQFRRARFVVTNIGFDIIGILTRATHPPPYEIMERNGRIYSIKIAIDSRVDNGKLRNEYIHCVDTVNIWSASVAQLGATIGLPKHCPPTTMQHDIPQKPTTAQQWEELIQYCARDAQISVLWYRQIFLSYCAQQRVKPGLTAANLAIKVWRAHYLDHPIPCEHRRIHEICFQGYYGGRTECFKRGTATNVISQDANSMYPWALTQAYPDPDTARVVSNGSLHLIMNHEGISYIEGEMPYRYIPLLPVRDPTG
jgi:hypothetical protein